MTEAAMKPRDALRNARLKSGLSQREVAQKVGVSDMTISNIETGRYDVKLPTARRLAKLLGMPVERLFPHD